MAALGWPLAIVPRLVEQVAWRDEILQTFAIMGRSINTFELRDADVVLRPKLVGVGSADFSTRKRSIKAKRQCLRRITRTPSKLMKPPCASNPTKRWRSRVCRAIAPEHRVG